MRALTLLVLLTSMACSSAPGGGGTTDGAIAQPDATAAETADPGKDVGAEDVPADDVATVDESAKCVRPTFTDDVQPLFDKYCVDCHDGASWFSKCTSAQKKAGTIGNYVANSFMPPKGQPQPSKAEKALIQEWLATGKSCTDPTCP